jgi:hypothetical protein
MRRRRSERGAPGARRSAALATFAALSVGSFHLARPLAAQTTSGATSLLLPLAARVVGVGGATVADLPGGEAVLSNPAGLAWLARKEGGLHFAKDFGSTRLLANVVLPTRAVGTFAVSATYIDYGEQEATLGENQTAGRFIPRDIALSGSYAASFGRRVSLGVTYSLFQSRFDCVGLCEDPTDPTSATAPNASVGVVDAGVQYDLTGHVPLRLGAAVRHLGLRIQVQDREQTDPLPTEGSVGARFDVPNVARYVKDAELHLLGEVVTGLSVSGLGEVRLGAEGVYRKTFALRGGVAVGRAEGAGPAVGFGYVGKRFAFDLATQFAGLSVDSGQPPTFVAFRYWF